MIKPNEEVLKAITNLQKGGQSAMFSAVVEWLSNSLKKETKTAVYEVDNVERSFAAGRCQELIYMLNHIKDAETELYKIETGKKLSE